MNNENKKQIREAANFDLLILKGSAIKVLPPPPTSSLMAVGTFSTNYKKRPKQFFLLNDKRFTSPPPLDVTAIKNCFCVFPKI